MTDMNYKFCKFRVTIVHTICNTIKSCLRPVPEITSFPTEEVTLAINMK